VLKNFLRAVANKNKNAGSSKQEVIEEFQGLPLIEQRALDEWGTVLSPMGRRSRWVTKAMSHFWGMVSGA
jgi:hypothetical protein